MSRTSDLQGELKSLQEKRQTENQIKRLKKQIRGEKFAQTKKGKVFNAIGDFGLQVGKKILTPTQNQTKKAGKKGSKKIKKNVKSVKDVMKSMDDAVNQFNY